MQGSAVGFDAYLWGQVAGGGQANSMVIAFDDAVEALWSPDSSTMLPSEGFTACWPTTQSPH